MSAQPQPGQAQQPFDAADAVHYSNREREGDAEFAGSHGSHGLSSSDSDSAEVTSSTTQKRGIVSAANIVSVITRKDIQIAYVA